MEERFWELGFRLNRIRKIRGETLSDVAAEVDISPQFLSMVEKGKSGISIENLKKLARHYNKPVAELIEDPDGGQGEVIHLDRARKLYMAPGAEVRLLAWNEDNEVFEPLYYRLPAGLELEPLQHDGGEYTYVLEGTIHLTLEDDKDGSVEQYELRQNDSIHYAATKKHTYKNAGSTDAAFLTIAMPRILQDKFLRPFED